MRRLTKFCLFSLLALGAGLGTACNHGRPCVQTGLMLDIFRHGGVGEPYGATDISAVTGNGGLTVALNEAGTITVFKWPNPSYYDQVKYMTTRREAPRMGALENEGIFAGLYYQTDEGEGFVWLRDLPHEQFSDQDPNESVLFWGSIFTIFQNKSLGIDVIEYDLVEPEADLLRKVYMVGKDADSKVKAARLVVYANFAPQVSKLTSLPIQDWCLDNLSDSTLRWNEDKDLFIQFKEGKDHSTGKPSSVYLAFGLEEKSSSHQAGYDSIASCRKDPKKKDAFVLAKTGKLPGSNFAHGKVTAGLVKELEFKDSGGGNIDASATLLISTASSKTEAIMLIEQSRKKDPWQVRDEEYQFWEERLAKVPLPATEDGLIRSLAVGSIKLILLGYSKTSGAGVASISTQPPYGLDWQRDGAFTNLALMKAGFPELVRKRNLFWAKVQSQPGHKIAHVPEGNWASNYYADGTPGFPIVWWEIDETGWALWSMTGYYEATQDRAYLTEVYPAIQRAADFLVKFKDPKTGLPKKAHEDDNPQSRQSTHGAVPCYVGLKHAATAAEAMGDLEAKARWEARAQELKQAILENFYDPACGRWVYWARDKGNCAVGGAGSDAGLLLWPGELFAPGDPRAEQAAEQVWQALAPSFNGERTRGMYEPYGLLILAHYWQGRPEKLALVKQGLLWEATVPITKTGLLGEIWLTVDGKIVPGQGIPQLWHHALFYLAAVEAYGTKTGP